MSDRLTSAANALLRTASVPAGTNFSMCGWVVPQVDTNNCATVFGLDVVGQATYAYLNTFVDGTMLAATGSGGQVSVGVMTMARSAKCQH